MKQITISKNECRLIIYHLKEAETFRGYYKDDTKKLLKLIDKLEKRLYEDEI